MHPLVHFGQPISFFLHFHMLHIKMSAFQGREYRKNDTFIKVDYNTSDPVVRWDSYENFNLHHQDSIESKICTPHTQTQALKNKIVKSNITSHSLLVSVRYLSYEGPSGRQLVRPGEEASRAGLDCLSSVTQRMPH